MQPKTKKCTRQELRSCASKVIVSRFAGGNGIEDMDWARTAEGVRKDINKSMVSQDGKDFRAMIVVISHADLERAAIALNRFLANRADHQVEEAVLSSLPMKSETDIMNQLILDGTKESISHHTYHGRGTRFLGTEHIRLWESSCNVVLRCPALSMR